MANKKVKLSGAQALSLQKLEPSIGVVIGVGDATIIPGNLSIHCSTMPVTVPMVTPGNGCNLTPEQARIRFATAVTTALVEKYGDLGGRNDDKIVAEALRLADLMVVAYFNT